MRNNDFLTCICLFLPVDYISEYVILDIDVI
jgi:hypothetical protein